MSNNIQSKTSNKPIQMQNQNQRDKPIVNVNSKSIGTKQNQPILGSNISTYTSTSSPTPTPTHTPRIPGNKKTSHKNKNKPKQQSKTKMIIDNNPKVSFNFKNNHVDKFYCHQMAKLKLTKTGPIDLESIPNLPEIPLEQLFGAQ
jgi:hypothetical protein